MKEWKKKYKGNVKKKDALKAKIIRKDNKGYFILIKEIIHLCHINIINPYAPNNFKIYEANTEEKRT